MIKYIPLDKIVPDEVIQIRVCIDVDRVNDFADIYDSLPPIKTILSDGRYYIADGFHRYWAAKLRNEKEMASEVSEGTLKDALQIAISENCRGALSLTREDRRIAVRKMLMFFPERGNTWIADDVGVSMQLVGSVRTEMEKNKEIPHYESLDTRDGRKYPKKIQQLPPIDVDQDVIDILYAEKIAPPRVQRETDGILDNLYTDQPVKVFSPPLTPTPVSKASLSFVDADQTMTILATILSLRGDKALRVKKSGEDYILTVYQLKGDRFYPQIGLMVSPEEYEKMYIQKDEEA